ncbi:hypothetical protein CARUB_v10007495mg, partial [Capsella rubella]
FYATNNPYQVSGPKGFSEFKYMEETHDLYVRLDFPGITKESLVIRLEQSRKAVIVIGEAPKGSKHDSSPRKYGTATGLICDCCVISNIQCFIGDGVVRLILSKKKINLPVPTLCTPNIIRGYDPEVAGGHPLAHLRGLNPEGRHGTDPLDPAFTGPVILPHPSVLEGSTSAYESKQLSNGGLYLRIDMPGVPDDRFAVAVDGNDVLNVMGRAPETMHDSSGRNYIGKVAFVPRGYDVRRIKMIAKLGVVRLTIPPY